MAKRIVSDRIIVRIEMVGRAPAPTDQSPFKQSS